ncbi:MAG: glycosyltransferase family 2 protein [Methylocapsa sp.]|nr:glycosyltransferase family 2 protein [Methylocapsa sp.]
MDGSHEQQHDPAGHEAAPVSRLPLVSVIIVNYNYGRYLRQAFESVAAQTYPNIECIVVDNASTDESPDILRAIELESPARIIRRNDNGGQSLAAQEGFRESTGEYVVFVDADDYLLDAFVETHVFVHLSLRIPVGFTSSDMFQAVGSRLVVGTIAYMSDFIRSGRGQRPHLLRRVDEAAPHVWMLRDPGRAIETQVHLVEPRDSGDWMWSPTSGNCFRRDALQLVMDNPNLPSLRSCTDSYLLRAVNVITGSAVIDRPLGVYRLHGMNVFSKHPHLNGVVSYDRGGSADHNQTGRKMIIDHLVANAALFVKKMYSPRNYLDALKALDESWPRLPSNVPGCRSYLSGQVVTEAPALSSALGPFYFLVLLKRLRASPVALMRAWARSWASRKKHKRN